MRMKKRLRLTARNFPTAKEDAASATPPSRYQGPESSFRLAYADHDFLLRELFEVMACSQIRPEKSALAKR